MDKYLSAIESEDKKLGILQDKRNALIDTNNKKKQVIDKYNSDEKRLSLEQEDNLDRKDYLENRKEYIRSFLLSSVKFGLKSSVWCLLSIALIAFIDFKLGSTVDMQLLDVILGTSAISVLFGAVEYYSVSKYFRSILSGYNGNIDDDIEDTYQKILSVQKRRNKLKEEVNSNEQLLVEVESAIKEVQARILEYRTSRNDLIEALIEDLDVHIRDFEYQESDIQKVLEKQIR